MSKRLPREDKCGQHRNPSKNPAGEDEESAPSQHHRAACAVSLVLTIMLPVAKHMQLAPHHVEHATQWRPFVWTLEDYAKQVRKKSSLWGAMNTWLIQEATIG